MGVFRGGVVVGLFGFLMPLIPFSTRLAYVMEISFWSGFSWEISWEVCSALFLAILSKVLVRSSMALHFVERALVLFEILVSRALILAVVSSSILSDFLEI